MTEPSTSPRDAPPSAVIHDIRYSRFTGDLRPRVYAVLALARSSALRALGVRRSTGAKIWPALLVVASFLPAVIVVGIPLLVGDVAEPLMTSLQVLTSTAVVLLAFTATTVPSMLTRDRGDRVLSLYFSTALSPVEYVIGKVIAAVALLLLVTLGPLLLRFVGLFVAASKPLDWLGDHADELPGIFAAAFVIATFHAVVALLLGSLTGRRIFAVGGYLAVMLVSVPLAFAVYEFGGRNDAALLLSLPDAPYEVARGLFGSAGEPGGMDPPTAGSWAICAVVIVGGVLALLARYRKGNEG